MPSREWAKLSEPARDTLAAHQLEAPVKLATIAKVLGLSLRASTLPAGISGEIRPDGEPGNFVIKVNRHDSGRRQRFTIAHEISHYLLHRDQIGNGIADDALYRSSLSDSREAEANRLASDILMPDHLVAEELAAAKALGVEDVLAHMADKFEVSEAAMRIRLGLG
ncbi:ImmA/IrrE family metallo-endopeptidase [Caulobacter sp. LARHSG274]